MYVITVISHRRYLDKNDVVNQNTFTFYCKNHANLTALCGAFNRLVGPTRKLNNNSNGLFLRQLLQPQHRLLPYVQESHFSRIT